MADDSFWLRMLSKQPFKLFCILVKKDRFRFNLHSVSRKGHRIPLMRKMKRTPDFLRSSKLFKSNKMRFFYFSDILLLWCYADKCLLHVPFSKKSHLPNTSGTILVMWFGILKNRLANGTVVTWIFRVTNWFCGHDGSSLSLFVHQKIQMGFLFYNLKKNKKPYH